MNSFFILTCLLTFKLTTSKNIFNKFLSRDSRYGQLPKLGDSAIARWMQQSGVAKRVCQMVESVETYSSGMSPGTGQATIDRCQIGLVKSSSTGANQKVCPGKHACVPTVSEVIHLRTSDGIKDVESAIDCACAPTPISCQRRPRLVVFHKGTKYARVVDVGKCAGNCGEKQCQPLVIKTVAIKSPNGRKTVKVVEKCGCESSCYRISYKKAYQVVNGNQSTTKVIDVGRCSGSSSCPGTIQGKCFYWADSVNTRKVKSPSLTGKVCLLRSKTRRRGCYAKTATLLALNTAQHPNKEVKVIDSCACA